MDKALTITCPHCKRSFALDDAILQDIRSNVRVSVEEEFERRKVAEVEQARLEVAQQAKVAFEQQSLSLRKQADDAVAAAKTARDNEKVALDAQLKLTQEKEELDLVYQRRMLTELDKARVEVRSKLDLDLKDRDQTINRLKEQIEDLQRKAELGSQQAQGDVLEVAIKQSLETAFPNDLIEDVPTGTRGADVIQKVNGRTGRPCGTIIWESKRTKAWAHDWLPKLKKNQAEAGAEVAVIVSAVLPEGVEGFCQMEGVWVTTWPLATQLASALRYALVELDRQERNEQDKDLKMGMLYRYLTSQQFRQRIQDIVEAFSEMDDEITKEKRAMERIWARREKLIERVKHGTVVMYSELEGIMGSAIPSLPALEMPYSLGEGEEKEGEAE
jgi:hypothetical protein